MRLLILSAFCLLAIAASPAFADPDEGDDSSPGSEGPAIEGDETIETDPNDFEVDEDVIVNEPEAGTSAPDATSPAPGVPEEEVAREDTTTKPSRPAPLFNERLDAIIKETIGKHRSELVPYKMPDQKTSFWRKIGPLNMTGEAGFIDNELEGLVNTRRADDAYLGRTKWGNVEMKLSLAVGPIEVRTNGYARFMGLGPRVSYKISVAKVDADAVLHFNNKTEKVAVKSFKVQEILGLKFQITRAPGFVTPFVANQIIRGGLSLFTPQIKKAVTRTGSVVLDKVLQDNEFVKAVMLEADRV